MTKVGIGVLGTEDAYDKMFPNLRTTRRVGTIIPASQYCTDEKIFHYMVHQLFQYQWIESRTELTAEMENLLHQYTGGIVDQLITVYSYLQFHAINSGSNCPIDKTLLEKVIKKFFPQMQGLLANLSDPHSEHDLSEMTMSAKENFKKIIQEETFTLRAKEAEAYLNSEEYSIYNQIKKNVVQNILKVSDDYNEATIVKAFDAIWNNPNENKRDENSLTKATYNRLLKGKTDRRPSKKKRPPTELGPEEMREFITSA